MYEAVKSGRYFAMQEKMLTLLGMSLKDNHGSLYKFYSWFVLIFLSAYVSFVIYDIVVYIDDIDIVMNAVYHGLAISIGICKMWIFIWNRNKLNRTLNLLQQGVFAPNTKRGGDKEEIWIAECIKNSNILMIAGTSMTVMTLLMRVMPSIIKRITKTGSEQWELPFSKFAAFTTDRSPNFELHVLFQAYAGIIASMVYVVPDYFIISVFVHISVQFKILCNSINGIVRDNCEKANENGEESSMGTKFIQTLKLDEKTWEYLAHKLKQNVIYHLAIIDLAQQLEDILNLLVLTNYVGDAVIFACTMYHASLYPLSDTRFLGDVGLGIVLTFQLFFISYFGNEVTLESALVLSACFEKKFFGIDIRLQKGLNIMMSRSQRPIKFTIGKFADLSLVSFGSLVRASWSYYMVLRNTNK